MAIIVCLIGLMSWPAYAETVKIKWNPGSYSQPWDTANFGYIDGWTKNFINDTVEERGRIVLDGFLDAEIVKHKDTKGPIPFVVLLHGCSGMNDLLQKLGSRYGAAIDPSGIRCSDFGQFQVPRRIRYMQRSEPTWLGASSRR